MRILEKSSARYDRKFCVLRTLGAELLGTRLMQADCAQGPVWQTTLCHTTQCPVIHPVAAARDCD